MLLMGGGVGESFGESGTGFCLWEVWRGWWVLQLLSLMTCLDPRRCRLPGCVLSITCACHLLRLQEHPVLISFMQVCTLLHLTLPDLALSQLTSFRSSCNLQYTHLPSVLSRRLLHLLQHTPTVMARKDAYTALPCHAPPPPSYDFESLRPDAQDTYGATATSQPPPDVHLDNTELPKTWTGWIRANHHNILACTIRILEAIPLLIGLAKIVASFSPNEEAGLCSRGSSIFFFAYIFIYLTTLNADYFQLALRKHPLAFRFVRVGIMLVGAALSHLPAYVCMRQWRT